MKSFFSIILLSLVLVGCKVFPEPADLLQRMVVQTTQDENTDFTFYSSFTLSMDTLGLYANWTNDTLLVGEYSEMITAKVRSEMAATGYNYVSKDQNPDLGFAITVFDDYNVYQTISYPSYYSGYYGFGYGGYYGPIVSTYESQSSTLVIHLLDLKNRDAQGRLKVIWKVYIGDLGQSVDPDQKVLEAIAQAFEQSPYLSKP
jgi:Domain of unknown function (DUF4136)